MYRFKGPGFLIALKFNVGVSDSLTNFVFVPMDQKCDLQI